MQLRKREDGQPSLGSTLPPVDVSKRYDVTVVGAGPAGMFLAAELARRGLSVAIVGLDLPIVNNYGVWLDEFTSLKMQHTLECSWDEVSRNLFLSGLDPDIVFYSLSDVVLLW